MASQICKSVFFSWLYNDQLLYDICSAIIHCNYCNRVIRLAAFVVHEIKDSMYFNIQINKFLLKGNNRISYDRVQLFIRKSINAKEIIIDIHSFNFSIDKNTGRKNADR